MRYLKASLIFFSIICLCACQLKHNSTKKTENIITIKKTATKKTFYFSGNLLPYKVVNVTAPTAGSIKRQRFTYGQEVKKGEILFDLKSSTARKDFETNFTAYLKAKEDFNHQKSEYKSSIMLYKKQLISKDEYAQTESSYYLSQLALLQAQLALKKVAQFLPPKTNVFALDIEDIHDITKTFSNEADIDSVPVYASANGIALFPTKTSSDSSDSDSNKKITVGSIVKNGQLLVSIGAQKGLSLSAKANELEINQLKIGMPATITSVAFPQALKGHIDSIDSQASDAGSLPSFNLTIAVTNIPEAAKKLLRIGMSAKAAVTITGKKQIQIPIKAVQQGPNNQAQVIVINPTTGKHETRNITTGETSLNAVVVLSGLKAGEKIVD